MSAFTAAAITEHAEWLDNLANEAEMESLVDAFGDSQPLLLGYLMEMGVADYREEEQETLFFLGLEIWHLYHQAKLDGTPVSEEALAASQEGNLALLESHDTEKPREFAKRMQEAIAAHPQQELMEHMAETLEDDPLVREQHQTSMLLYLKIFIDCMEQIRAAV
ncbi:MAG: hypothetical protein AAFV07_04915 [Bacteroidota bacterium]